MLVVMIGGSGSGKSEYAENYIVQAGNQNKSNLFYVATMQPFDEETRKRIRKHQIMRECKNFVTIESFTGVNKLNFPKNSSVLLECMSNLVANEMFAKEGSKERTMIAILEGIENIRKQVDLFVIVTNNVFEDGTNYNESTKYYLKTLAEINRNICSEADAVIEVVHGIPINMHGN